MHPRARGRAGDAPAPAVAARRRARRRQQALSRARCRPRRRAPDEARRFWHLCGAATWSRRRRSPQVSQAFSFTHVRHAGPVPPEVPARPRANGRTAGVCPTTPTGACARLTMPRDAAPAAGAVTHTAARARCRGSGARRPGCQEQGGRYLLLMAVACTFVGQYRFSSARRSGLAPLCTAQRGRAGRHAPGRNAAGRRLPPGAAARRALRAPGRLLCRSSGGGRAGVID